MTPFPGELQKVVSKAHPYMLTDEQQEWLRDTFPVTENIHIVRAMGISYPTLYKLAKRYGLKKSDDGMNAIRKRQGEWHKRQCRQERLRLLGGGQPRECTNIRLVAFTKSQISRRNKAVKLYGYIVTSGHEMHDNHPDRWVIFYDRHTKRSKSFESNGQKDGFIFKEL